MLACGYDRLIRPVVLRRFFMDLIKETNNFSRITWLGQPIWQNILDLWTVQQTLYEIQPELLIECGTNRGGSALFYAHLFDLIGKGHVVTIDIQRLHEIEHPRITFMSGSSTDPRTLDHVDRAAASVSGHVMVILDSDHSAAHVGKELDIYSRYVTPGSYILVQDGIIDVLPSLRADRPGPLAAIREFLPTHPEFQADLNRSNRFLISHHPMGWLKRTSPGHD
jgi:cephalosporin hydroxylase